MNLISNEETLFSFQVRRLYRLDAITGTGGFLTRICGGLDSAVFSAHIGRTCRRREDHSEGFTEFSYRTQSDRWETSRFEP